MIVLVTCWSYLSYFIVFFVRYLQITHQGCPFWTFVIITSMFAHLFYQVDTFFAVGSPLGVFLALRNIRIGVGIQLSWLPLLLISISYHVVKLIYVKYIAKCYIKTLLSCFTFLEVYSISNLTSLAICLFFFFVHLVQLLIQIV